jgi:DNA-binding transcriptional LysR family regulator
MDRIERIGRRIKMRDLQLLDAVVRWGSIAKAATHLNLTQPAASKAIGQLERAFGVRLLDRSARGVEPTLYGRALLNRGVAIFDELRQGVTEIDFLADPTVGELRIGSTASIVTGFLSAVLDRLCRRHPRMVFHVTEASFRTLQERDLRERKVDLIIGPLPSSFADDATEVEILFQESLSVVAGATNRWIRRRRIELAELVEEPWTLPPPDSPGDSLVADTFHANGIEVPRISVVTFSVQLRNAMLASGRFLGMASDSVLQFGGKRLGIKTLPVQLRGPLRRVGIVTLKNRTITPAARLFIERARELAKVRISVPES